MSDTPTDRASRMCDFGMEEAGITFNLGDPPSEDDLKHARQVLAEAEEEVKSV